MSLGQATGSTDEGTPDDDGSTGTSDDAPGKRSQRTAAALGIAAGMTGSLTFIGVFIAYLFGIERQRLSGDSKTKLKYAAKNPLFAVVGICLGYVFNLLVIGETFTIPGVI